MRIPERLAWREPIDSLVLARIATREEIRRSWSIRDVMDYHELLDLRAESDLILAEHREQERKAAAMWRSTHGR